MISKLLKDINEHCGAFSTQVGSFAYQGKDPVKCLEVMRALENVRYLCDQAMEAEEGGQ